MIQRKEQAYASLAYRCLHFSPSAEVGHSVVDRREGRDERYTNVFINLIGEFCTKDGC